MGGGVARDLGSALNGSISDERYTPPDEGGSHSLQARPGHHHQRQGSAMNHSQKPSTLADFKLLQKIGKVFSKIKRIGNGAYSEVYRVKRISDNKEYALKKVRSYTDRENIGENGSII